MSIGKDGRKNSSKAQSKPKRFPLRLDESFSKVIDTCVFYTEADSKHQYIIDAIKEKVERDKSKNKSISIEIQKYSKSSKDGDE